MAETRRDLPIFEDQPEAPESVRRERSTPGWVRATAVVAGLGLPFALFGGTADAASHAFDGVDLLGAGPDGAQFTLPPTTYDGIATFDAKTAKSGGNRGGGRNFCAGVCQRKYV